MSTKPVRLCKYMKDEIVDALVAHAFGTRKAEMEEAKHRLASDIYHDVYPPDVLELMNRLPPGFLPMESCLRIKFEGTGVSWKYWDGENRPVSRSHESSVAAVYPADHPFSVRNSELEQLKADLEDLEVQARASARAVLDSAPSVKRLIEIWPEVEPFASKYLTASPGANLPALPIADLNARLGLPPQ